MEKIELTEGIIGDFRSDHRKMCGMLIKLVGSLKTKNVQDSKRILLSIDSICGPHMRFEEEYLYPELKRFFGDYIDRFYMENDMLIHTVRSFLSLLEKGSLTDQEIYQSIDAVRMLIVHICNSEGLLLMCEQLGKKEFDYLTEKCAICKKDGVPMLKWADTMRRVNQVA